MKSLFVLRHAKSSWADGGLADFDRPLNDRGKATAPFMGQVMRDRGIEPSVILSSPAERAKQTAELVRDAAGLRCEIRFDDRIYEADAQTLIEVIRELSDENSAMLVGHNPGFEGLVRSLTGRSETMPTAALAIIQLEIDEWSAAATGCGQLIEVIRPKDEQKSRDR
jgi:phosphohistidine phosphatase